MKWLSQMYPINNVNLVAIFHKTVDQVKSLTEKGLKILMNALKIFTPVSLLGLFLYVLAATRHGLGKVFP